MPTRSTPGAASEQRPIPKYHERRAAEKRRYWERHRERLLAEAKVWRQTPEGQAYYKQYHETHRNEQRLRHVLATFNLSVDDYHALVAETGGRCPICRREIDEWVVDHDHSCCPGKNSCGECVRGLLCKDCNWALGFLDDDPQRCQAAARYLRKHSPSPLAVATNIG